MFFVIYVAVVLGDWFGKKCKERKVSFETKNVLDLFLYYISSSLFFYD